MTYSNLFKLSDRLTRRDEIYLTILNLGLHRIRGAASRGDFKHCEIESDHLHNLPRYVAEGEDAQHAYYYVKERPYYLHRVDQASVENEHLLETYQKLWAELEGLIPIWGTSWEKDWIEQKMQSKYPGK